MCFKSVQGIFTCATFPVAYVSFPAATAVRSPVVGAQCVRSALVCSRVGTFVNICSQGSTLHKQKSQELVKNERKPQYSCVVFQ